MKQNETGENWWRVPVPNGSERHGKAASFGGDGLTMLGPRRPPPLLPLDRRLRVLSAIYTVATIHLSLRDYLKVV
jgi:hypothetical protein